MKINLLYNCLIFISINKNNNIPNTVIHLLRLSDHETIRLKHTILVKRSRQGPLAFSFRQLIASFNSLRLPHRRI